MPHAQLLFATQQGPSVCVSPGCFHTHSLFLSHSLTGQSVGTHNIILGAGTTRHLRNYSPEGKATHQQRPQYSLTRIISVGMQKEAGVTSDTAVPQERFRRKPALRLKECMDQIEDWLFRRRQRTMETSQC